MRVSIVLHCHLSFPFFSSSFRTKSQHCTIGNSADTGSNSGHFHTCLLLKQAQQWCLQEARGVSESLLSHNQLQYSTFGRKYSHFRSWEQWLTVMKPEKATLGRQQGEPHLYFSLQTRCHYTVNCVAKSDNLKVNCNQIRWVLIYSFPTTVIYSFKGEITQWLLFWKQELLKETPSQKLSNQY